MPKICHGNARSGAIDGNPMGAALSLTAGWQESGPSRHAHDLSRLCNPLTEPAAT